MAEVPDGRPRAQGRIGAVIKDKWRIDARLGAGGMATVYAATHRNGNRVAIKMLHPDFSRDPAVRQRFLREGYVANAVAHPGAVKILDDDVAEDGSVFLVMELLEGESLEARRLRIGGRLPVEEVFTVGDRLLDLLAAAHDKGIIHRDIKPENVFVTHHGDVKVLDFGIARMRQLGGFERTGTGLMLGTPDYMSPEQAGGHPDEVDVRSDLWAVGASLFTLLSGQSVHTADTLREYLLATATMPPRSLATVAPWVPAPLVRVVDRALELDKGRRWLDARAMQDALRRAYKSDSAPNTKVTRPDIAPSVPSGESLTIHAVPPVSHIPGSAEDTAVAVGYPASHLLDSPPTSEPKTIARPSIDDARDRTGLDEQTQAYSPVAMRARAASFAEVERPNGPPVTSSVLPIGAPPGTVQHGTHAQTPQAPIGAPRATLGAQLLTDPRHPRVAPSPFGRRIVMGLAAVLLLLAGVATFLVVTGRREAPFRASQEKRTLGRDNASPAPSGGPIPPQMATGERDAGARKDR